MAYYSTLARVKRHMGTSNNSAAFNARLAELIQAASELLEEEANRRFDRYYETQSYTPRQVVNGGDLSGRILMLNGDLVSVTTLTNGNSEPVADGDYDLLPLNSRYGYSEIDLAEGLSWTYSGRATRKVGVTGLWGYGGTWVPSGATITVDIANNVSLVPVSSVAGLEQYMLIRIGDELLTINTPVTSSPIRVDRGVNGSTATAHVTGAGLDIFQPHALVMRTIDRLVMWLSELDDNPSGRAVVQVGDWAKSIDITAAPDDALALIEQLRRKPRIRPV